MTSLEFKLFVFFEVTINKIPSIPNSKLKKIGYIKIRPVAQAPQPSERLTTLDAKKYMARGNHEK